MAGTMITSHCTLTFLFEICIALMRYEGRYIPLLKNISVAIYHRFQTMSSWGEPKELRIPVPYGHIAAKAWGKETDPPVLALHGWQDNAGTFDRLIPLLTPSVYIVAMDAPGHGLSSHKPLGTFYHFMEMVLDVKRVVDYFKWNTFCIMGHSLGGACGLMYASIYPESVSGLISFDIAKPNSRETKDLPDISRKGIMSVLDIEKKITKPAPVYSFEEAKERLVEGLFNEVNKDAADILLKRGCRPSDCGKGVVFCRDIRLKMLDDFMKLSHDDLRAYMKRVTCKLLIIRGKASFVFQSRTPEVIDEFLGFYKGNCKYFEVANVEGNHFAHLNNPDQVAPLVNNFLNVHYKAVSKI